MDAVFGYTLAFLLAVVGPGDAEHEGDEEGQLGVGQVAVAKVDDAVEGPDSRADGPYPCCATHWSPYAGFVILWTQTVAYGFARRV